MNKLHLFRWLKGPIILVALSFVAALVGCGNNDNPVSPPPGGTYTDNHTDALRGGPVLPVNAGRTLTMYKMGDSLIAYQHVGIVEGEGDWRGRTLSDNNPYNYGCSLGNHGLDRPDPIGVWIDQHTLRYAFALPQGDYLLDYPVWYGGSLFGYAWVGPGGKSRGTSFGQPIRIDASGNPSLW